MQLWFARRSGITFREQLVTQVILGILSGDLAPGQRLPSTRELARRFHLHPNTVSGGYRQLQRERWVEFRHGSGVYVQETKPDSSHSPAFALDPLISDLFRSARSLNVPLATLRLRLHQWLDLQPPDHFLLIEPDEDLRRIAAAEIQRAVNLRVENCGMEDSQIARALDGAVPLALPNHAKTVRQALPKGTELLELQVRSVSNSLSEWLPAPSGALVGVASRWTGFLKLGRTILAAAGFHSDSLVFRDARKSGWKRGLKETAVVICDCVTAEELPSNLRTVIFPLLSEAGLADLRCYEDFLRDPLGPGA